MSITKIPLKLRVMILDRDGRRCLWCGKDVTDGVKLEVDHIHSEKFEGNSTYENLGTLCNLCNRGKGGEFYGPYLLATLFKVKNLKDKILDENLGDRISNGRLLGILHILTISFLKKIEGNYEECFIYSEYRVPAQFEAYKDTNTEIQINDIKKEAIIGLKNKIGDYLFENKGFLEEDEKGRLIFREIKELKDKTNK